MCIRDRSKPIKMLFGFRIQVGPGNNVFDGVQIPMARGNFGESGPLWSTGTVCRELCNAWMADPIEIPFGMLSQVHPNNQSVRWGFGSPSEGAILRGKGKGHAPTSLMTLPWAVQKRQTDRDATWVVGSGGLKEPCIRLGSRYPMQRSNF